MKHPRQPKNGTATTEVSETPRISPKEYIEILKGVNLEDLYLEDCTASVDKDRIKTQTELAYSWKENLWHELVTSNLLRAKHSFELRAPAGAKRGVVLKISCTFGLTYSSKLELSQDFLVIFLERNVLLNTWPYFREVVQSMTQRMNIPSLVLPLVT